MAKSGALVSNLNTYLEIARGSLLEAQKLDRAATRPKADGKPGSVITYDPERRSYKLSLIALVFEGVYLDALLYIVGVKRLGKSRYGAIENRTYECKLFYLGIDDTKLLKACERFRKARNDLVHEKAIEVHKLKGDKVRFAQDEAKTGMVFIQDVAERLKKLR
jgi:hypothetical protein